MSLKKQRKKALVAYFHCVCYEINIGTIQHDVETIMQARAEAAASLEKPSRPQTPEYRGTRRQLEENPNFNMLVMHSEDEESLHIQDEHPLNGTATMTGKASMLYEQAKKNTTHQRRQQKKQQNRRRRDHEPEGTRHLDEPKREHHPPPPQRHHSKTDVSPKKMRVTAYNVPKTEQCDDECDSKFSSASSGTDSDPTWIHNQNCSEAETDALAEAMKMQTLQKINKESSDVTFLSDMLEGACNEFSELVDQLSKVMEIVNSEEDSQSDSSPSDRRIGEICQKLLSVLPRFISAAATCRKELDKNPEHSKELLEAGLEMVLKKKEQAVRNLLSDLAQKPSRTKQVYLNGVLLSLIDSHLSDPSNDHDREAALAACKNLFILSKSEELDNVLRESNSLLALLEQLRSGLTSMTEATKQSYSLVFSFPKCPLHIDALVYAVGTIKNASNNSTNSQWLAGQGAVEILSHAVSQAVVKAHQNDSTTKMDTLFTLLNLRTIDESVDNVPLSRKSLNKMILQACGALRNLCLSKKNLNQFWKAETVQSLLGGLTALSNHGEVVLTICRCLSKLSLHEKCRRAFNRNSATIHIVLEIVRLHCKEPAIITRAFFVLGNVMTDEKADRYCILSYEHNETPQVALDGCSILIQVLRHYHEGFFHGQSSKDCEDVLRKGMRLLANLSIAPNFAIRAFEGGLLPMMKDILRAANIGENEELVLNTVAALTNVSFNIVESFTGDKDRLEEFCSYIEPLVEEIYPLLLLHRHGEALMETVRALANLSRIKTLSQMIANSGAMSALLILLLHPDSSLAATSCGVLTNIAHHPTGKNVLYDSVVSEQGVLRDCGAPDRSDLLQVSVQSPIQALDLIVDVMFSSFQDERYRLCIQAMRLLYNYLSSVSDNGDDRFGLLDVNQLSEALDIVGKILDSVRSGEIEVDEGNIVEDVGSELLQRLRTCVSEGLIAEEDDDDISSEDLPKGGILARRKDPKSTDLEPL